jgi:spore photoproduct lyase
MQTTETQTKLFYPDEAVFEPEAMNYELGRCLYKEFEARGVSLLTAPSHNRLEVTGTDHCQRFHHAKRMVAVGIKHTLTPQPCCPSADYRLILNTSCPAKCHYCYLAASLGERTYVRLYVNIDEILKSAKRLIKKRAPEITTFEASSSSDPVALEHLTGSLRQAIGFFGRERCGRLRVVTKSDHVDNLLDAGHQGHTRFRFSINAEEIINKYEEGTASLEGRLDAARRVHGAGYPLGFIIAPLILYEGWRLGYEKLLDKLAASLPPAATHDLTFELIMHRFTQRSRRLILERFPGTTLAMDTQDRIHKGFGKYVYEPQKAQELEDVLRSYITERFPHAQIEYFT